MKVTLGWPKANGPSAVTLTGPVEFGSVKVTVAIPELLVTAITLVPVNTCSEPTCRFCKEPLPEATLKNTLAPVAVPPDPAGESVTASVIAVPWVPLPGSVVLLSVAAGLPTTNHPPWVVPSLAVMLKWQKPGLAGPFSVIAPGDPAVTFGFVAVPLAPLQGVEPSKLSKTGLFRVMAVLPLVSFGDNATVPPAPTMVVSGLRSHSEAGGVEVPEMSNRVAV